MWKNQTDADPGTERVLELNGTIAEESWYDDDVTPRMFRDELFAGSGDIIIWINSPGGDCVAASQIYSMLMHDWNDTIWTAMIEKAIVHKDGQITFVFQNGTEIKTAVRSSACQI